LRDIPNSFIVKVPINPLYGACACGAQWFSAEIAKLIGSGGCRASKLMQRQKAKSVAHRNTHARPRDAGVLHPSQDERPLG